MNITAVSESPLLLYSFISGKSGNSPSFSVPANSGVRRRRYRVAKLRCSGTKDIFGPKRELNGVESIVNALSPPVRLAGSALIFAVALAAGYGLGSRRNAAVGGAVALGAAAAAAAAAAAYSLNSCAPEVAAVNLHNYVASSEDPLALDKEHILAIPSRYGVSKQDQAFSSYLSHLYLRFVSSVLPSANEDLKGTEVETIIKFKNALGIDDPDAANMHIEIARRIFRQRLETGDRDGDMEQRRAFQKLVYVSTLVFGEASAFLLPCKRVFKITDAQVEVAIRDNAQRLYAQRLKSVGIGLVSLVGGEYNSDRKIDDLKLLYREYVTDSLSSGQMEESKLAALNQLKNIFGLGKREAEAITMDVTSKVYCKLLAQAVLMVVWKQQIAKQLSFRNYVISCDLTHKRQVRSMKKYIDRSFSNV